MSRIVSVPETSDFGTKIIATIGLKGTDTVRWTEKGTPVKYTPKNKR